VPVPVMIMVMPVIAKPVRNATDAVGAAPLDEGPLLRCRTSIICSLMPAFDPRQTSPHQVEIRVVSASRLHHSRPNWRVRADRYIVQRCPA